MQFEKKILNYILLNLKSKIDKENRKVRSNITYTFNKNKETNLTTKYDVKIEKIIRKEIEKKFSSHEIMGEELKNFGKTPEDYSIETVKTFYQDAKESGFQI